LIEGEEHRDAGLIDVPDPVGSDHVGELVSQHRAVNLAGPARVFRALLLCTTDKEQSEESARDGERDEGWFHEAVTSANAVLATFRCENRGFIARS
jgi:hypothetical protein